MTAHFLLVLVLGLCWPPSLSASLCLSSAVFIAFACVVFPFKHCVLEKELKFIQAAVCWRGFVFRSNGCFKERSWTEGVKAETIECEIMLKLVIRQR